MHYERVVVTGASSGFGAEFARRLAPETNELLLVARREERLHALAEELCAGCRELRIRIMPCDLANPCELKELKRRLGELPPVRTLLVNNAGLGDYGDFLHSDSERNAAMLAVNIIAPTELTHALLPAMAGKGGGVINLASLAAELPIPDFAVYAAAKAYVASFSEALRLELHELGIPVVAVCPGPVHTEFGAVARRSGFTGNMTPGRGFFDSTAERVVTDALRGLRRNRARVYPSLKIRQAALLLRLLPLPLLRIVLRRRPRRVFPDTSMP